MMDTRPSTLARPGQREIIDVVVRLLEQLHGATAVHRSVPDEDNRQTKDVDLFVVIGDQGFALEHTSIDYSRDARKVSAFWRHAHPHPVLLRERLLAGLPGGEFAISFWGTPEGPGRCFAGFADTVAAWVLDVAPLLPPATTCQIRMKRVEFGEMSAMVRLSRYAPEPLLGLPPTVEVFAYDLRPGGPDSRPMGDAESKAETLRRAFADKVPDKLARYKTLGHRTVLVLEDVCRDAMPFDTLRYATHLLQGEYAGMLDMVVIVGARELPWSLQYSTAASVNNRELRKNNWWLYVPQDRLLVQRDWDLGIRRTIERADPVAFERVLRGDAADAEPWGGQWNRLA